MTRRLIGAVVAVTGLAVIVVALVALIDPVGTKMADDADPFGEPPSTTGSLATLAVGCAATVSGGWFALRRRTERRTYHAQPSLQPARGRSLRTWRIFAGTVVLVASALLAWELVPPGTESSAWYLWYCLLIAGGPVSAVFMWAFEGASQGSASWSFVGVLVAFFVVTLGPLALHLRTQGMISFVSLAVAAATWLAVGFTVVSLAYHI